MKNLVTFTRNDRPDGALRFGQMDGDVVTDLTDDFAGSFDTLSDAANAGALDTLFDAGGASRVALDDVTL